MPGTNTMKHFEEWAKDKNPLIKTASLVFAISSEDFLEFLELIKAGKRIEGYIDLPPVKEWLGLYRNHRQVYHGVTNIFRQLNDETAKLVDFYEDTLSGSNMLKHFTSSEWNNIVSDLTQEDNQELLDTTSTRFKELDDFIVNDAMKDEEEFEELSKDEKRRIHKLVHRPEMTFFIRVWAPCFLLYGEYPPSLLRKARRGDDDGLEKLLRLDKSVLDDPKIMAIFHKEAVSKKRGKMTLITKALHNTPKAKLDIQKIKYLFGGLISIISIALGQKLTALEIHALFDAVACDKGNETIDPDLIVSPETFEKAIQRARTFWQTIPLPDKK